MPKRLLVSDANILIDVEIGGLLDSMFELDYEFAVPDVLFEEELSTHHPQTVQLGLRALELGGEAVAYVVQLLGKYPDATVSRNDLLALALARQEQCPLLTGDNDLRVISDLEGVDVHGTLWIVEQLLNEGIIDYATAETAYQSMRDADRRLPWDLVEEQLGRFRG